MKAVLLFTISLLSYTSYAQLKRFVVDAHLSKGETTKEDKMDYSAFGGRVQYNFPWLMSVNIGFDQEHCSFRNVSFNDIPTYVTWTSRVRTTENTIPIALRATLGKKVMFYAEGGMMFHFKRKAHWVGSEIYLDPSYQDTAYDFEKSLSNSRHFFYGAGLSLALFKGINVFGEFRKGFRSFDPSFVGDDHLYFWTKGIKPYTHFKISFGISYTFNFKKESTYVFSTWGLKAQSNRKKDEKK